MPRPRPIPARRLPAQALVEFALVLPLTIMALFAIQTFWQASARVQAYGHAAQTLAEWIGRQGLYDPATMAGPIQAQLDDALGVGSAGAYLFVHVESPAGDLDEIGAPVPASVDDPPGAPGDAGWDDSLGPLAEGSTVTVDIYGFHHLEIPLVPVGEWIAPAGHAVFRVIKG